MEPDRADEADLTDAHDGRLVGADDGVVRLGAEPQQRGVEDVHEEEEEDAHPGDAVEDPRPHALAAAVERAAWSGLLLWFLVHWLGFGQGSRRLLWHEQPSLR